MPLHLDSVNVVDCGPHRTASRCVSWSASGLYLAFGSSDRLARLVTVEPTQAREVLVISGHQGPVTQTRFHPVEKTLVRIYTRRNGCIVAIRVDLEFVWIRPLLMIRLAVGLLAPSFLSFVLCPIYYVALCLDLHCGDRSYCTHMGLPGRYPT